MRIVVLALLIIFGILTPNTSWTAHPNPKIIITDVLDDDIRALVHILSDPKANGTVLAIVTTTGNTVLKAAIASRIVTGLKQQIPVYAGTSTDLTNHTVTEFAGRYEREGYPLLSLDDIQVLRKFRTQSGYASDHIARILREVPKGLKVDILCLTAPTDLVKAIKQIPSLAKQKLGDLFAMGFYKRTGTGVLVAPYNSIADPHSVYELLKIYQEGFFSRMIHVPSDTVQLRSGLPSGYIPPQNSQYNFQKEITDIMKAKPTLRQILSGAEEYGMNWRDFAVAKHGIGLGTDLDRWVPSTFASKEEASRFYMSDTIPTILSILEETELHKLPFNSNQIEVRINGNNLSFNEPSTSSSRHILDLYSFDGILAIQKHIEILRNAATSVIPKLKQKAPSIHTASFRKSKILNLPQQLSSENLVVIFKNSPDDWFAITRLVSTQKGRSALQYGGIICEGFDTEVMSRNVQNFLAQLGITNIRVAAGTTYLPGDIDSIPNFKGELALAEQKQSGRAFETLSSAHNNILTAEQLLNEATKDSSRKTDLLILGEGIDLFRYTRNNPSALSAFRNLYVMGGGRIDASTGKLILSRNWLPHTNEVIDGLEQFSHSGKEVLIFSSNEFGGSFVSSTVSDSGNGNVAFSKLSKLSNSVPALKTLYDHWINWSRIFNWVISKSDAPFDPTLKVEAATISPLALFITEEWLLNKTKSSYDNVEIERISLSQKLQRQSLIPEASGHVFWLKRGAGHSITSLAEKFGLSVQKASQMSVPKEVDTAIRRHGIFHETTQRLLTLLNYSSNKCLRYFK